MTGSPDTRQIVPDRPLRSYYNRPVLKRPVWRWMIPAYFYAGGVSGASSLLAAGAALTGRTGLARRARLTALGSITAGAVFLVADLGKPERFANMLRVAKPSSPMSVGSWILAGYGPAAGVAAASDVLGLVPFAGGAADVAAGVLGAGVSTYTAVLVADTAVPIWHEARHELPFLFASGAAASAGAIASALAPTAVDARPALRLAVTGAIGELAAATAMDRKLNGLGLADPLGKGRAGRLSRASKVLVGSGAVVLGALGRRRPARIVGGALLATGAALTRFAVMEAGKESAGDPAYVVGLQRHRQSEAAARAQVEG